MSELDMEAVERLRICKREYEERVSKGGEADGRIWAAETATYAELRDLSLIDLTPFQEATSGLARFLFVTEKQDDHLKYNADDFDNSGEFLEWMEFRFGSMPICADWVYHHTKGAQAFYREIKDLL